MEQWPQGLGGDLGAPILRFSIGFWGRGAPQAGGWPYTCRGGVTEPRPPPPRPLMSSRRGRVGSGCVEGFLVHRREKSPQRKVYKYCGQSIGPLIFDEGPGHSAGVNSPARSHSGGVNGKLLIERHSARVIQRRGLSAAHGGRVFPEEHQEKKSRRFLRPQPECRQR